MNLQVRLKYRTLGKKAARALERLCAVLRLKVWSSGKNRDRSRVQDPKFRVSGLGVSSSGLEELRLRHSDPGLCCHVRRFRGLCPGMHVRWESGDLSKATLETLPTLAATCSLNFKPYTP